MNLDLSNGLVIGDHRHGATKHFGPLFAYGHLQPRLQEIAGHIADAGQAMVDNLADGVELSAGLRKLLEAKDCFVRAAL